MTPAYSLAAYEDLLAALIASGRPFAAFSGKVPQGALLLRHDVDYDLDLALTLARVNAARGVTGTFFVQTASPFYNPMTRENRQVLADIAKAGQWIGLHYQHFGPGGLDAFRLNQEYSSLSVCVPEAQRVVAWHNPGPETGDLDTSARQAGFASAYAPPWLVGGRYVSDSNRARSAQDILKSVDRAGPETVQVLIHPFIWALPGDSMEEMFVPLRRYLGGKLEAVMRENNTVFAGMGR